MGSKRFDNCAPDAMPHEPHACSVCGKTFSPEFSYQTERLAIESHGSDETRRTVYFCSQSCLARSHEAALGGARCSACGRPFTIELASHVFFVAGRRYYACTPACRADLLEGVREAARPDGQPVSLRRPDIRLSLVRAGDVGDERSTAQARPPGAPPLASAWQPTPDQTDPTEVSASEAAPPKNTIPAHRPTPVSWRRVAAALAGPPQVLAVFNHKGGTGKTTTAVTLAGALSDRGKRVLLVDTDGQGNVAISLGLKPLRTLYHVLVMGQPFTDAVVSARPGLDVLASNATLAAAELYLAGRSQRDRVLASRLTAAQPSYDHIIVDCSPSLSLMSQNTLAFADAVLCPVACDYLSLVGVRQVLRTIRQVNRVLGHPVRLWGVLPTLFDARARVCHEALAALRQHFGDRCLQPVRASSKAKEAPAHGKTLAEYAPEATTTLDYLNVVDRLLRDESSPTLEPLSQSVGGTR